MKNHRTENGEGRMHYSPNLLSCINNAIENRALSTLSYSSKDNEITIRTIEPMAVIYKNNKRHLVAWCRLREDWRTFRLDRIELLKLHKDTFKARDDFDVSMFESDDSKSYNEQV